MSQTYNSNALSQYTSYLPFLEIIYIIQQRLTYSYFSGVDFTSTLHNISQSQWLRSSWYRRKHKSQPTELRHHPIFQRAKSVDILFCTSDHTVWNGIENSTVKVQNSR